MLKNCIVMVDTKIKHVFRNDLIRSNAMDIIFHGRQNSEQAVESLMSIIRLFQERYQIGQFREMHLSMTLVDDSGADVELIDTETELAYRTFEVYRQGNEFTRSLGRPALKLVIDNTEH